MRITFTTVFDLVNDDKWLLEVTVNVLYNVFHGKMTELFFFSANVVKWRCNRRRRFSCSRYTQFKL